MIDVGVPTDVIAAPERSDVLLLTGGLSRLPDTTPRESTFLWFHEEVGELTRAVRRGHDRENLQEEFADVFAWLVSMASMLEIDMEQAVNAKYGKVFQEAGLRG